MNVSIGQMLVTFSLDRNRDATNNQITSDTVTSFIIQGSDIQKINKESILQCNESDMFETDKVSDDPFDDSVKDPS